MENQIDKPILGQEAILIVIFVIIVATLSVIGIYLWQKTAADIQIAGLEEEIKSLKIQLDRATKEETEEQLSFSTTTEENFDVGQAKENRYVRLVSPTGGEKLCVGDEFTIRWESGGLEIMKIILIDGPDWKLIDTIPATYNEDGDPGRGVYTWKAGKTEKGISYGKDIYKIVAVGEIIIKERNTKVTERDYSDIFSIFRCEG